MNKFYKLDSLILIIYFLLVCIGFIAIYSSSYNNSSTIFSLNSLAGKQLFFFIISLIICFILSYFNFKEFIKHSNLYYITSIFLLIGVFIFGTTISGSTSWYKIGGFSFQPAEFAKVTTALYISKILSGYNANLNNLKGQVTIFSIIIIPVILIILQPDPGSAIIFFAFLLPLLRAGLSYVYFIIPIGLITIFILSLLLPMYNLMLGASIFLFIVYLFFFFTNKKRKYFFLKLIIGIVSTCAVVYSTNYIFNNVFEQRHRDRFNIILGKQYDVRGIGYNINQSKIAIGSGGIEGKGYLQGTQNKGNFVPEQSTDYIFTNISEEWGFFGSILVIILFSILIARIVLLAEKQKDKHNLFFGYSLAAILFFHFTINIGMTLGLLPTVGIPLPFISYGGSNLLIFSIFIFTFLYKIR